MTIANVRGIGDRAQDGGHGVAPGSGSHCATAVTNVMKVSEAVRLVVKGRNAAEKGGRRRQCELREVVCRGNPIGEALDMQDESRKEVDEEEEEGEEEGFVWEGWRVEGERGE